MRRSLARTCRNAAREMIVVRLFNTVGPRQAGAYGMVLPRFVRQAIAGDALTVYGDGKQTRCFTDVHDVVRALRQLLASEAAAGGVYNIGSLRSRPGARSGQPGDRADRLGLRASCWSLRAGAPRGLRGTWEPFSRYRRAAEVDRLDDAAEPRGDGRLRDRVRARPRARSGRWLLTSTSSPAAIRARAVA